MVANDKRIVFMLVKCCQCSRQTLDRLFLKKNSCDAINHRCKYTTSAVGNHRSTRSLSLQGSDAKIFIDWEQERPALCIVVKYYFVGEPSHVTDSWARQFC